MVKYIRDPANTSFASIFCININLKISSKFQKLVSSENANVQLKLHENSQEMDILSIKLNMPFELFTFSKFLENKTLMKNGTISTS